LNLTALIKRLKRACHTRAASRQTEQIGNKLFHLYGIFPNDLNPSNRFLIKSLFTFQKHHGKTIDRKQGRSKIVEHGIAEAFQFLIDSLQFQTVHLRFLLCLFQTVDIGGRPDPFYKLPLIILNWNPPA
jgi:hypothetical protein